MNARSDEQGKTIVYLDNATIINACTAIAEPGSSDPYKLLDLETFCESFVFYDYVRTLVGHSFSAGFYGFYDSPDKKKKGRLDDELIWKGRDSDSALRALQTESFSDTATLYQTLVHSGLLRPVQRDAGHVHYGVEGIARLDAIAKRVAIDRSIDLVRRVFQNGIPWSRDAATWASRGEWNVGRQAFDPTPEDQAKRDTAAHAVAIGERTWTSDSYPTYYFPDKQAATSELVDRTFARDDFGPVNRRLSWEESFVSQTFYYFVEANIQKRPFVGSSVRIPIIQSLVDGFNEVFISVVDGCLANAGRAAQRKLEEVRKFFGGARTEYLGLPALYCVLKEARNRGDFFPALFRLRARPEVQSFRNWCATMSSAWRSEDIDAVLRALDELKRVSDSLAGRLNVPLVQSSVSHVANASVVAAEPGGAAPQVAAFYSPGLVFLKDVATVLEQIRASDAMIDSVLGYKLSSSDRAVVSQLLEVRSSLYTPGQLDERTGEKVIVQTETIRVGDEYNTTIQNSTLGAVAVGPSASANADAVPGAKSKTDVK